MQRYVLRMTPAQAHAELRKAVLEYLSEHDNEVIDTMMRLQLRDRLRKLVGAPDEPEQRGVVDTTLEEISKRRRK